MQQHAVRGRQAPIGLKKSSAGERLLDEERQTLPITSDKKGPLSIARRREAEAAMVEFYRQAYHARTQGDETRPHWLH